MAEPAKRAARKVAPAPSLAGRIKTAPKLSAPDAARKRVTEWLGEIGRAGAGKAIGQLLASAKGGEGKLAGIVAAIAEASPYLWDLIRADRDRFLALLEADPETQFAALIAEIDQAGLAVDNDDDAMRALRRGKSEAALLIALTDLAGVWPVERITRALTEFADAVLRAAVRYLLRCAAAQGKFSPRDPARPEQGSGYVILAMGKMGAFELNYSSDIDLIVLYDESRALAAGTEPAQFYVRLTRALVKLMQERT